MLAIVVLRVCAILVRRREWEIAKTFLALDLLKLYREAYHFGIFQYPQHKGSNTCQMYQSPYGRYITVVLYQLFMSSGITMSNSYALLFHKGVTRWGDNIYIWPSVYIKVSPHWCSILPILWPPKYQTWYNELLTNTATFPTNYNALQIAISIVPHVNKA